MVRVTLLAFVLLLAHTVKAAEWNCASTSGTFERTTDCTMSDEVAVSGDLTVTGKETLYSTLTAASGKRHFKITSGAQTLRLKWLNMTGANITASSGDDSKGGSIHVQNVAAHLNISRCVFFNNRALRGGAVYAVDGQPNLFFSFVVFNENNADYGGAVYLKEAKLVDHSSIYAMNTAGQKGGALFATFGSHYSSFDSSLLNNTAVHFGGGISIYGSSSSPSELDLTRVLAQENKQTDGEAGGYGDDGGGGGLFLLSGNVTANIRECTFIRNEATEGSTGDKHGHQMMTNKVGSNIPSIAIVNTNFTDVSGSNPFYGYDDSNGTHGADKYVDPMTCASNPCTVSPFTGGCYPSTSGNQGILCDYNSSIACTAGSYKQSVSTANPLPPPETVCAASKPEWDCSRSAGAFQLSADCTMGDEVAVDGDLSVTGNESTYTMLTAASGKRHFKITSGAHTLRLKWLNLTGGDVGTCNSNSCCGGSINVYNVAAHLNISHCVFLNNRAGLGGAISANNAQPNLFFHFVIFNQNSADQKGGAVYLEKGKLSDHASIYTKNTAGRTGGALCLYYGSYSSFDSSLVSNTAGRGGGGIFIRGDSSFPSFLNLSSVTVQSNKQIDGGATDNYGGGGLLLSGKVTANIRECTFIRNEATEGSTGDKHGHQMMTNKDGSNIPSIAIVNTNFTHVSGSHPFYGYDGSSGGADKYVTPTTCASNPCTAPPFTGGCYPSTSGNQGILCDYDSSIACATGSYKQSVSTANPLPPPETVCAASKPEWDCSRNAGEFQRSTDCTMTDEVSLSGDLSVTGREGNYTTLTAASGKRHFKITSGAHTLRLKWLNMTGADITANSGDDSKGGSIHVKNVAAHLNISRCVFFNNRAYQGGAIFAQDGQPNVFFSFVSFTQNNASWNGGAVYFRKGKLVDHASIYTKNTAMGWGGALFLSSGSHSFFFDSSLVSNTAGRGGGGIYILGYSYDPSFLNFSSVTLQSNKQIHGGIDSAVALGGGGLYLFQKVTANVRECTFIRNEATEGSTGDKHGHQMMTNKDGSDIPSIAIVNTNFTDVSGSHPFYGYDGDSSSGGADKYVSPTNCADNPCSVSPFTGSCKARTNEGHGVLCMYCPAGHHDMTSLPPPSTCTICATGKWSGAGQSCASCPTGRHIVDPGLNASLHDEESDCTAAEIIGIHPNNQSTLGGTFTTFIGNNFGATSASRIQFWTNQIEWTNVTYVNDTCITGISPAGAGFNFPISINVDGITYESTTVLFSYQMPNITKVIPPPFNGGTLQLHGTDFGQLANIDSIMVSATNGCSQECNSLETPSTGGILCQYNQVGAFGETRTVRITVAGQTSYGVEYSYDVDKGEITGVPAGLQVVSEMEALSYSIGLTDGVTPTSKVVVHLQATSTKSEFNCTVVPVNITIYANDNGTITPISIKTSGNVIDEGTDTLAYSCSVLHSLETIDPQYASSPQRTVTVNVMNDDQADTNLWIISDLDDSYSYEVKLLSFYSLEGGSFQYGVRLDTEPRSLVRIEPQISLRNDESIISPPILSTTPEYVVFDATNWSVHQRFVYSSIPDSTDNDLQVFEITHDVTTDDEVFRAKSTARKLKVVVNAADDDTAKLLVESKQIILTEGGDSETITISGLASKPTSDVNITIEAPPFLDVQISKPVIKRSEFNNFTQVVQLRAISGATPGSTVIKIKPRSLDPKYNHTALGVSMDIIVLRATIPAVLGIPLLAKVNEGDPFSYEVKLSTVPSASVKINVSPTCDLVTELNFVDKTGVPVIIPTKSRKLATAKTSVVDTCTVVHRAGSNDPDYSSLPDQTLRIDIISTGCGTGEYRGPFNRTNETECICGVKFYKPPILDCAECPEKGLICDRPGIKTPAVANDYWRHDPSSPDFNTYPIYECIIPDSCTGGNSTKGRCAEGYNDSAPICAVCAKDHVFQQGICSYCEGYVAGGITSPTPQMMTAALLCMFFGMAFLYYYFTLPALSRQEENDLRVKLSSMDIESLFEKKKKLNLLAFSHLVDAELTDNEIAHIFRVIDKDKNDFISKTELIDYTTDVGKIDIDDLQAQRKSLRGKQKRTANAVSTLGTAMVKFKILLTYIQCMSFLPVVFELPFPETMTHMMKLLEFSSLDIYVVFGEVSCHMQTTFKQKFVFHMLLFPVICACVGIVWKLILLREKYLGKYYEAYFTRESMRTRLYTFGSLLAFGLYAGLSTKIFRLFKCKEVQERFYLVADYSVECYVGTWWNYGGVAILCIIIYVMGIPGIQFYALWNNRHHLHETSALDHQSHRLVKKQFGSLYASYTEDCFYFEMVNMFRKLMMTGGLILVGEESVVQALLGILTCSIWVILVAAKFPYRAYWDNMLEIALSFGLLMSLISGFALELFHLKDTDGYEQVTFDVLLVLMILGCIFSGVFALVITLPICRSRFIEYFMKGRVQTKRNLAIEWVKKNLPVMKWLSMDDFKQEMRSFGEQLEAKANRVIQTSQKKKRMSKIYPTKKTSLDAIVKTNILAKKRKKILAIRQVMLPAYSKKKKPAFKTLGTMAKEHVKSKFRQRKLHTIEVNRIHKDREQQSHHLKKKQEEMNQLKLQKKKKLEERLKSRKK